MSIDPALYTGNFSTEFPDVKDLSVKEGGVYVFDFDGVIIARTEDEIYKLPEARSEIKLFKETEHRLGVDFSRLGHQYRRHLLFQAAAWHVKLPIKKGNGFNEARCASSHYPFFILTARSGWYAVERQRKFVDDNNLRPIDCYNVGRVRKDRQIAMLALEFQGNPLYYVDDSPVHCEMVMKLGLENVKVYICRERHSKSKQLAARLYQDVMQQFLASFD